MNITITRNNQLKGGNTVNTKKIEKSFRNRKKPFQVVYIKLSRRANC